MCGTWGETGVDPRKLVLNGRPGPQRKAAILWLFGLESNSDECKGGCSYKGGCVVVMRPFAKFYDRHLVSLSVCIFCFTRTAQ